MKGVVAAAAWLLAWSSSSSLAEPSLSPLVCGEALRAKYNMSVPGGGKLELNPIIDQATINDSGQVAFRSSVSGSNRNQGIFVADAAGLHPIVFGCGGNGGWGMPGTCGDASPIGGTFAGLFDGSAFVPDINDAGDVLFYADVTGGPSSRGLFLHRAGTGQIERVAVLGDPMPSGGVIASMSSGSLNNAGKVVFQASAGTEIGGAIGVFLWDNGTTTTVAKVGQTISGMGIITQLGGEWVTAFDGTKIPVGPLPDINNHGDIAYRAVFSNQDLAMVLKTGTISRAVVREGESTPIGGVFEYFHDPVINDKGQMAFWADVQLGPEDTAMGWVVGTRGHWRMVFSDLDTVDGKQIAGMAVSRNPMQPLDDEGNLLIWCKLKPDDNNRLLLARSDGSLVVLARQGDMTAAGVIDKFPPWPSMANCARLLSMNQGHMVYQLASAEIGNLVVTRPSLTSEDIEVSWEQGVVCPSEAFDVARGTLAALQASGPSADAACAADAIAGSPYAEPAEDCATLPGDGCWYLVREQGPCGPGPWGVVALDSGSPCP